MGFKNSLRKLFYQARAIPGKLELRPYRVYVVVTTSAGAELGQGPKTETATEITEASSQPPKVRQLTAEEIAVGGYDRGTIEVGPVTPDFPGGGTQLETLVPDPQGLDPATVHIRVVGGNWPNGAHFRIREVRHDRTFGYRIVAERSH